jgi:UDP-glucose 4-epimerase
MQVLVCGGAGYIGSHCLRKLKEAGFDCIVYDNLSAGHSEAVRGFELIEGDLLDAAKLDWVFADRRIDGVIHFAAYALVGESMKRPLDYFENNVAGSISLLKAMVKARIRHIVFSSTCAVYGEAAEIPITEDAPLNPCNPYGQTKHAVEQILSWCGGAHGVKSVCLRYFNAAGAMPDGGIGEDHALETHLIQLIFRTALNPEHKLTVFGGDYPTEDGSCVRDYVHVLDLADAHVLALRHLLDGGDGGVFNLGTGTGVSVLEMIRAARRLTGTEIPYETAGRRPGDPPILTASAQKAEKELGWRPKRGISEILADAWRWHSSHPQGFQDKI